MFQFIASWMTPAEPAEHTIDAHSAMEAKSEEMTMEAKSEEMTPGETEEMPMGAKFKAIDIAKVEFKVWSSSDDAENKEQVQQVLDIYGLNGLEVLQTLHVSHACSATDLIFSWNQLSTIAALPMDESAIAYCVSCGIEAEDLEVVGHGVFNGIELALSYRGLQKLAMYNETIRDIIDMYDTYSPRIGAPIGV